MTAAGQPWTAVASIGSVLGQLKSEFPDVSISKIRFLESEGLVTPHRTPSGYRQFSAVDVERLRYVLAAQRDHYLPLRVIKEHLDSIDRGVEPATERPRLPRTLVAAASPNARDFPAALAVRLSRAELLEQSALEPADLTELEQYGLLVAGSGGYFDANAAHIGATIAELLAAGLEPRHLRQFRTAAERESALVAQLVAAQARQKDPDARERAGAAAASVAATVLRLHSLLVKAGLQRELGI